MILQGTFSLLDGQLTVVLQKQRVGCVCIGSEIEKWWSFLKYSHVWRYKTADHQSVKEINPHWLTVFVLSSSGWFPREPSHLQSYSDPGRSPVCCRPGPQLLRHQSGVSLCFPGDPHRYTNTFRCSVMLCTWYLPSSTFCPRVLHVDKTTEGWRTENNQMVFWPVCVTSDQCCLKDCSISLTDTHTDTGFTIL